MSFVLVLSGLVLSGIVGSLSAMAGQRYERRRWERRLLERAGVTDLADLLGDASPVSRPFDLRPPDERLNRLEQAVDTIAVEMERVGEGQRFITKLLAERPTERPPHHTPRSPLPGAVRPSTRTPA